MQIIWSIKFQLLKSSLANNEGGGIYKKTLSLELARIQEYYRIIYNNLFVGELIGLM